MDILSKDQRHKNMAAIHSANTKPEMIVRKYLFVHGFRYRLNHPRLPGRGHCAAEIPHLHLYQRLFLAWS